MRVDIHCQSRVVGNQGQVCVDRIGSSSQVRGGRRIGEIIKSAKFDRFEEGLHIIDMNCIP